jgi:hypothetical protein
VIAASRRVVQGSLKVADALLPARRKSTDPVRMDGRTANGNRPIAYTTMRALMTY